MTLEYLVEKYIEKTGYGMDMWTKEENHIMTIIAKILEESKLKKDLLPSDCYIRNKIGCHCTDKCEYENDIEK